MPTKTCTAAPNASAPLIPIQRRSSQANAPVTRCITPQWNSNDASALITNTIGSALNARMKLAPGCVSANGSGAPPR